MAGEAEQQLRAYVDYLRDLGVYDLYRRGAPGLEADLGLTSEAAEPPPEMSAAPRVAVSSVEISQPVATPVTRSVSARPQAIDVAPPIKKDFSESEIPKPISFDNLTPLPEVRFAAAHKPAALNAIREDIGDCTRCPLAYAGRRKIVFADGDPSARLMFVGEGPGADEDAQGLPFVGKAGQLLNNMIGAMGLKREQVYIANIVKCRPPANRVPEPVEANTCSQFLLRQIDVVQPQVIVALGSTAATYLLGVKQSLAGLRGKWHSCRGAKVAVTYHPAFLLRDPRQKGEAWKDLQMVMKELGLKAAAKG
jgi:uracil-DNA glycosylase family 4